MKIVHVITRFIRGGADENTLITCNQQSISGHDIILISGAEWNEDIRHRLEDSVRFLVVTPLVRPVRPFKDIWALLILVRLFRDLRPDVVHTHTSKAGILGRLAGYISGIPHLIHGVHILPFNEVPKAAELVYVLLERLCGRFTSAFVYVSMALRDEFQRRGIGGHALHAVAESGMDVSRFRSGHLPSDYPALTGSPVGSQERPLVLLVLAALEPRKRQLEFLDVFNRIVAERPNTLCLLGGEGSRRAAIESRVRELELERYVKLLGFREDPERLLAVADVVVIPSAREGLPRVAVQAAIAGVPIVTTALPGVEAAVTDGETGFVVPVDDLGAMEKPILKLLNDDNLRRTFSSRLRGQDWRAWDEGAMAAQIERVYQRICSGGAR